MSDFETWWDREGSETACLFGAKNACETAWKNGTYKANEGLLAVCEKILADQSWRSNDNSVWPELTAAIAKAKGEA